MHVGEVLGTVTCAVAAPPLTDIRLKAVRVYQNGQPAGVAVAGGAVDAANGEFVYLMTGWEAAYAFGVWPETVDYAVIGRVEDVHPGSCYGRL